MLMTFVVMVKGKKMVKVFTTNQNGKIEFEKDELENLLNEVWNDGHNCHETYWWTSPTVTPSYYGTTITCNTESNKNG